MDIKHTKAVTVAKSLIDKGVLSSTHDDIDQMPDCKLFKLLNACGYFWDGREWVEDSN
jgi:hypothetical protein